MARTEVRSEQIKDKTILLDDLAEFAVTKRTTGLTVDINAGRIQNGTTVIVKSAQTLLLTDGNTDTSPIPDFLAHYNTNYTDLKVPLTPTTAGTVTIDTGIKKFAAGSAKFNGANSSENVKLTYAANAVFAWPGDFEIDCQVRYLATWGGGTNHQFIWSNGNWGISSPGTGIALVFYSSTGTLMTMGDSNGPGGGYMNTGSTRDIRDGAFHHIKVCRSGTTIRLFIDGILEGSNYTCSDSFNADGQVFLVGQSGYGPTSTYCSFTGYIDELRILSSSADGTSNFTPPAAEYNTTPGPATNYIELTPSGVATGNIIGFTTGNIPLATTSCAGVGNVETVTDKRTLYQLGLAPSSPSYILKTANAELTNAQALSTLTTGLLKNTTVTGVLSIATQGSDYYAPSGTDVAVADGGTGVSALTAYAPIFGGTTTTGPVQSGTVGTAGQVLTSNGAGALPTFQAPSGVPSGAIFDWPTHIAPSGYLLSFGQAVSRATYPTLFGAIVPQIGTFTVTVATPAILSLTGHGLSIGDSFYVTTTGTLPTGFSANTLYYVITAGFGANSFQFSASYYGTAVNTSGTQSGVHTLYYCPWGLGDGSTTFNLPDFRGRSSVTKDNLGGTAANRLANPTGSNIGKANGEENHTLSTTEMPAHTHNVNGYVNGAGGGLPPQGLTSTSGSSWSTSSAGSGSAHNNMQPHNIVAKIIKI